IKATRIDIDGLARDRDQLFAEALILYQDKTPWWPDKDLESGVIALEQADRYEADAWEQVIQKYLANHSSVTIFEISRDVLDIKTNRLGTADTRRIAGVLENLGWK